MATQQSSSTTVPPYYTPSDLRLTDATALTQILTHIPSSNPTLSAASGTGEAAVAEFLAKWLQHWGVETSVFDLPEGNGRPSVVGVVRGTGGGKSLMINGHIDTVSFAGYEVGDALGGEIVERNGTKVVQGRGALDMKAGIAAGMALLLWAKERKLRGDVLLAAVADEEHLSKGTEELLRRGWRADAAVVTEPTGEGLGVAHKGFVWVEIKTRGVAAHGSMPAKGVDAIEMMGRVLGKVAGWRRGLPEDEILGRASAHCGTIKGGEENSSYPGECSVVLEIRTVPGQETEAIVGEIRGLLEGLARADEQFVHEEPKVLFERKPYRIQSDHELVSMTQKITGGQPQGVFGWCDAALLGEAGIPSIVYGPKGEGLHGKDEWVEIDSIEQTTEVLKTLAERWCS